MFLHDYFSCFLSVLIILFGIYDSTLLAFLLLSPLLCLLCKFLYFYRPLKCQCSLAFFFSSLKALCMMISCTPLLRSSFVFWWVSNPYLPPRPLLTTGSKHQQFYLDILQVPSHQYAPNWIIYQTPPSSPPWCTILLLPPTHSYSSLSKDHYLSELCYHLPRTKLCSLLCLILKSHQVLPSYYFFPSPLLPVWLWATVISQLDYKNDLLSKSFALNPFSPLQPKWFPKT